MREEPAVGYEFFSEDHDEVCVSPIAAMRGSLTRRRSIIIFSMREGGLKTEMAMPYYNSEGVEGIYTGGFFFSGG